MGGTRARLDRLASHLTTDGLRAWRSTPFRLTLIYGTAFIVAIIVLLGAVYGQTADFLIRRVDGITRAESSRLAALRPEDLPAAIRLSIANDHLRLNRYGLFSPDGQRIEGDGPELPAGNPRDQTPRELVDHDGRSVRVIARVLPWGEVLLVGRDTTQLVELRRVLLNSLLWSGGAIAVVGFTAGVLLSRRSLRRLAQLEAASSAVVRGDLRTRMPLAGSGDELDLFALAINRALEEVEQLMLDIKGVADAAAHDLRTPLTRVRAALHRVSHVPDLPTVAADELDQAIEQLDGLLERFRALLRISEIEAQDRCAAVMPVGVSSLVEQALELYAPLAEEAGVTLVAQIGAPVTAEADGRLLFEALANLVDNAIKFSPPGGRVEIGLRTPPEGPELYVRDHGPGIRLEDRQHVLKRFHRGAHHAAAEGSGLGLSIVGAIVRLHGFSLHLDDAHPGLEVRIGLAATKAIPLKNVSPT